MCQAELGLRELREECLVSLRLGGLSHLRQGGQAELGLRVLRKGRLAGLGRLREPVCPAGQRI